MLGMTIAFNSALTFHLFKGVLVAFRSSKLNNYGATLFSLRDKFPEQFQVIQTLLCCQVICFNNDKIIYTIEEVRFIRLDESQNNTFTKKLKYHLSLKIIFK